MPRVLLLGEPKTGGFNNWGARPWAWPVDAWEIHGPERLEDGRQRGKWPLARVVLLAAASRPSNAPGYLLHVRWNTLREKVICGVVSPETLITMASAWLLRRRQRARRRE